VAFFQNTFRIWIGILSILCLQGVYADERNQILVGGGKNFPVDKTQSTFASEKPNLYIGYHHGIDSDWSAILSIHFRNLYNTEKNQSFSLLSADQAILYKFPLHDATTLHVGAKFMYLLPVFGPTLPLERNKDYPNEIGAAALIGIRYAYSERFSFFYYLERWRGTKTTQFHGVETLLALGFDV
jgi:hypothetical protein